MLTDGAALALGALAAWMARRPPSERHSYGLGRAEVLAALVNAAAMLHHRPRARLRGDSEDAQPTPVNGGAAALIALAGLLLNLWVMRRLAPHHHDMNARAARLHVLGDVLGSVAALVSGALIALSGWTRVDPIASLVICVLIALSALRLLRESLHALMEGVPHGLSVEAIGARDGAGGGRAVGARPARLDALGQPRCALGARRGQEPAALGEAAAPAAARLHEKFGIDHVTLQPETGTRPLVRH